MASAAVEFEKSSSASEGDRRECSEQLIYTCIVCLNNRGVAALQECGVQESVVQFRTALQFMVHLLQGRTSADAVRDVEREARRILGGQENPPLASSSPVISNQAFIQAINLVPSLSAYSDDRYIGLSVAFALIMFNMANVFHYQALVAQVSPDLQPQGETQESLLKAKSFYAKCEAALADFGFAGQLAPSRGSQPLIDLLTMILYNNQAQLANQLCEYEEAKTHIGCLVAFATAVETTQGNDPETASILGWHKMFFLNNVSSLWPPAIAAAA